MLTQLIHYLTIIVFFQTVVVIADSNSPETFTDEIRLHKKIIEQLEKISKTLSASHNNNSTPEVEDQTRLLGKLQLELNVKQRKSYKLLQGSSASNYKLAEIFGEDDLRQLTAVQDDKFLFDKAYGFYKVGQWSRAYELFQKAWSAFNDAKFFGLSTSYPAVTFVDYLQATAYKLGNFKEAIQLCRFALAELEISDDYRTNLNLSLAIYQQQFEASQQTSAETAEKLANTTQYQNCGDEFAFEIYKKLSSTAFCRLDDRNRNPRLILAPVKEEILSLDPLVVFFHNLATPSEAQKLTTLSQSQFRDAKVFPYKTGQEELQSSIRRAKIAWIETNKMSSLANRIEAYTGLNSYENNEGASEMFQVGRYGIGGHYIPHHDLLFGNSGEKGDRLATLLIYLSDVERGGDTVFTELKLRVTPKAYGGLFWFNLRKDNGPDMRLIHAACPVIGGEKWVTNKWFRYHGQAFKKPCGLKPEEVFRLEDFAF